MTDISKKQYILSSCKLELVNMQEHQVAEMYLYTSDKLNISKCETVNGKKVFILGNAFCTDVQEKRVEDDINSFSGDDIQSATSFWSGRWTLITETELVTDATGLMGAFYGEKDENWFVSSSLALVAETMGATVDGAVKARGVSWQILPDSIINGVKKLLSTQKISFSNGNMQIVHNNWIKDYREKSTEEKCNAVANILVNAVKNMAEFSDKKLMLALTGGKDSRVTFSALVKAGVPFECYTAEHENLSSSDKTVPKKLSGEFGVKHNFIKRKPISTEMLADYYHFSVGNSKGADASFYACKQFSCFGEDTIVIRSGLFEAGQTYARSYTLPDIESFEKGITTYYSDLQNDENQKSAFSEWLQNAKENPIDYVDIRDRFYIEQRVGGWAAAIEQSLDINDFTSIQIANCAELLSILLTCDEKERETLALSYETIKILEPKALEIPVNQVDFSDKLLRLKRILRNPIKKLKNFKNKL